MSSVIGIRSCAAGLVVGAIIAATAGTTSAATVHVYLRAEAVSVTMPDAVVIPMWGYARDAAFAGGGGTASVPGPVIRAAEGDTLTIHLDNNLGVPISVVIPGQSASMTPVYFTDGQGRQRAKSFTHETPAGNTTEVTYTWPRLRAGTYLYHSGTHPAVQVQMGLYGALIVDSATPGRAYGAASTAYDAEALLVYSEIDPALHTAVATGDYGPGLGMTSTMDYQPKYFLINGQPHPSTPPLPAVVSGQRVLLRFVNAGIQSHAPLLLGSYMSVIAENGRAYRYAKEQYSLFLPAGQTRDTIVTAATGRYPIYDRQMNLTNAGAPGGGMLTYLVVNAGP